MGDWSNFSILGQPVAKVEQVPKSSPCSKNWFNIRFHKISYIQLMTTNTKNSSKYLFLIKLQKYGIRPEKRDVESGLVKHWHYTCSSAYGCHKCKWSSNIDTQGPKTGVIPCLFTFASSSHLKKKNLRDTPLFHIPENLLIRCLATGCSLLQMCKICNNWKHLKIKILSRLIKPY